MASYLLFCFIYIYINVLIDKTLVVTPETNCDFIFLILLCMQAIGFSIFSIKGLQFIVFNNTESILSRFCFKINYYKSVTINYSKRDYNMNDDEIKFVLSSSIKSALSLSYWKILKRRNILVLS